MAAAENTLAKRHVWTAGSALLILRQGHSIVLTSVLSKSPTL